MHTGLGILVILYVKRILNVKLLRLLSVILIKDIIIIVIVIIIMVRRLASFHSSETR